MSVVASFEKMRLGAFIETHRWFAGEGAGVGQVGNMTLTPAVPMPGSSCVLGSCRFLELLIRLTIGHADRVFVE